MDTSQHRVASSEPVDACEEMNECTEMREISTDSTVPTVAPSYVTLVAKDDEVFMAPRDVLLKASPFFAKMLNSDTKENEEGVIRLQIISASLMEMILKFMYYGRTQINNVENAKDLMIAADYLILPSLKILSEQFIEKRLSASNCISTYYFANEHHFEELATKVRNFIHSNFASVVQSDEFMDLPSQEIEKWFSSDEIAISAEEDVFKTIEKWIARDKSKRTEKFKELFRHVRLTFVSRDYLSSCIAMNALVKEDAGCSDYVTQAINWLDGARGVDCHFPWQQSPRKFQQTHVIVACRQKKVLCYFPNQDKWKKLPDVQSESASLVSCRDKLYAIAKNLSESERYEPRFNVWVPLVKTKIFFDPNVIVDPHRRNEMQVFVVRGEIYTVASNPIGSNTLTWKYDFDSNSWKSFPAFDWGRKDQVCVVPTEEYIYAIGGRKPQNPNEGYVQRFGFLSDVERFDTEEKTWEKLADIQVARRLAFGCTMQGQIFIAGGIGSDGGILQSCELYKILENEWQFISSLNVPRMYGSMMCVSGKLYVLGGYCEPGSCQDDKLTVECYDQENNQWTKTTMAPFERITEGSTFILLNACSAQLFNGVVNTLNNIQSPESAHPTKSKSSGSRICRIM